MVAHSVWLDFGFNGIKYFKKRENAERYAESVNKEKPGRAEYDKLYMSAREYMATRFEDDEPIEQFRVPYGCVIPF